MKIAEEWRADVFANPIDCDEAWLDFIAKIQLDAWKQGMSDASEVLHEGAYKENLSPMMCEYKILAARDNKTSL